MPPPPPKKNVNHYFLLDLGQYSVNTTFYLILCTIKRESKTILMTLNFFVLADAQEVSNFINLMCISDFLREKIVSQLNILMKLFCLELEIIFYNFE